MRSPDDYLLIGGLEFAYVSHSEARFLYHEIFGERCYLQEGVALQSGDVVFDVGANIGLATVFFARECDVVVYAFEPVPAAFEVLRENVDLHRVDARLFNEALGREPGSAALTYYPHSSVNSSLHPNPDEDRATMVRWLLNRGLTASQATNLVAGLFDGEQIACRVTTISDVMRAERVERVDLLKIDVERGELEVLEGIDAVDWGKIHQVVLEVHGAEMLRAVAGLLELHDLRVTVRQDVMLHGTSVFRVYATRNGSL